MSKAQELLHLCEDYDVYENPLGSSVYVHDKKPDGTYYIEVDNKWDKIFRNKQELEAWLKANKYRWVGSERDD